MANVDICDGYNVYPNPSPHRLMIVIATYSVAEERQSEGIVKPQHFCTECFRKWAEYHLNGGAKRGSLYSFSRI